jgi:hypothetical protein
MMKTLLTALLLVVIVAPGSAELTSSDITYIGAFAPPKLPSNGPRYGWGMYGLDYDASCGGRVDPSPNDGYPGCLVATSHKNYDMIGWFDVIPPVELPRASRNDSGYDTLMPRATEVVPMFDPSGGIKEAVLEPQTKWTARDIPGVVVVGNDVITTCGHDWYNVSETDYDPYCWVERDGTNAAGAWGAGEVGDRWTNSQRMAWYLGRVDQDFADATLGAGGKPWCFSGMQRMAGGKPNMSAGPSMLAFPCARPVTVPPTNWGTPGFDVVELLNYPHVNPVRVSGYSEPLNVPDGHSPHTQAQGAEFVGDTVIVSRNTGGPVWWYGHSSPYDETGGRINHRNLCWWNGGNPVDKDGNDCTEKFLSQGPPIPPAPFYDECSSSKGYHASFPPEVDENGEVIKDVPQRIAELILYRASDLPQQSPGSVMPYEYINLKTDIWGWNCPKIHDLAFDSGSGTLWVTEERKERPVIHGYRIGTPPPPPTGSCCVTCVEDSGDSDQCYEDKTRTECSALSGVWSRDGVCASANCDNECPIPDPCPDQVCDDTIGETCETCPQDCGECPVEYELACSLPIPEVPGTVECTVREK